MKDEDYIHDSNPTVGKLLKLKYRINDAYRNNSFEFTKDDKEFVMVLIHNIRNLSNTTSRFSFNTSINLLPLR